MEVWTMAKKNQYGFRNEVIKDFTPEQINELIQQKKIIEEMNAEDAYKSIMDCLKEWHYYASSVKFNRTTFLKFVDELARTRQQVKDGFLGYAMAEKIGGSFTKTLLEKGSFALIGVLAFYMMKYISDEKPENEFTRQVMVNLTKDRAWDENNSKGSYALRNFHGKAMAIFHDEGFVLFLEDEFGITDNTYKSSFSKEFVKSWAEMYLCLDEMFKSEPEKFEGLMPKTRTSTIKEKHLDNDDSKDECEKVVDIESLFKVIVSMQRNLANANEGVQRAEKNCLEAEEEVDKIEKKIEDLTILLQNARQNRDLAKSAMEAAKREKDRLWAEYTHEKKAFDLTYQKMFGEMD